MVHVFNCNMNVFSRFTTIINLYNENMSLEMTIKQWGSVYKFWVGRPETNIFFILACADGLKKLDPQSGSHAIDISNHKRGCPSTDTVPPFLRFSEKPPHFSPTRMGIPYGGPILILNPWVLTNFFFKALLISKSYFPPTNEHDNPSILEVSVTSQRVWLLR